jgi:hypothetical protein
MSITTLRAVGVAIVLISLGDAPAKQAGRADGADCEAERRLCRRISLEFDRVNRMPYHVAKEESCAHIKRVCENIRGGITQLGQGFSPEMEEMYRACLPLLNGGACGGAATPDQDAKIEIDAAKVLWQPRSKEIKYLGKVLKVLPPRIEAEGWEYDYARGNGTGGTKKHTLMLVYRYRKKPANWQEALGKVGLPTDVPPVDFGTSYIWPARGIKPQPIRFRGRVLNRVILAKDFSEITVDGHEPGTY